MSGCGDGVAGGSERRDELVVVAELEVGVGSRNSLLGVPGTVIGAGGRSKGEGIGA